VLGVGIDWAETFHVVALGRPGDGVVQVLRVEHSKPALEALLEQLRALEPDPGEVRVVLETRHGLLVERLVEAGFAVVPVNPDLIARRRGPAKKKDDVEDARIACLLALDRFQPLRPLIPHGELAAELRSLGRDDERACQDERRLLNRLRADLLAVFPAAVQIAGPDMGAPTFLRMLQRWPTATALAATSRQELVAFARAAHSGYPERFADRVGQALGREHFTARQTLAQAKVDTIQLTRSPSCCSSAPNVEPGSGAWVSCCWAHPDAAAAPCHLRPNATRDKRCLAARSTSAFPAWVTVSPPGSPVRSATIPNSSRRRTRCNATPARLL